MKNYIPLKVECWVDEDIVCGKILQQDERIKKNIDDKNVIISNDSEYKIKILYTPELDDNILYLRGADKETDNYTFYYKYTTKDNAARALDNFKVLINTLNNYYKDDQGPINKYTVEICE